MRANDMRETENGTYEIAAYINCAFVVCARSSDLMGTWLDSVSEARAEAEFHRKCIEQWRSTLVQIEREPKPNPAVHTGKEAEVPAVANHRETKLEMARRHVHEGEAHVALQREIVARLPADGEGSLIAEQLLREFERTLREHKTALARFEKQGGA